MLPPPHLVDVREEIQGWAPRDDEEPTNPYPRDPRKSGTVVTRTSSSSKSLTVPNLSALGAAQLAGIIAAWETADDGGRLLLAEFAKRLGRDREK